MRKTGDIFSCKRYSLGTYITMRKTVMLWLWTCIICDPKQFILIGRCLAHIIFIPMIQKEVESEKRSFNLPPIHKLMSGGGRMYVETSENIIHAFHALRMPSGYWSFRNPSGWSQSGCVPIYWILWDVYIQPVGDRTFSAMAWETFWVQTASWCVQISPWHGNGRWRTVTETRSARLRTEALGDRRTQGGRVQCQVGILFSITTVHKQLSQTLFAIPWSTEAVVQNPAGADSGSPYPGLTVNGGRLTQFLLIISKGIFSQWKGCFLKLPRPPPPTC